MTTALDLGIEDDELLPHPTGGRGVRSHFDLWTTPVAIKAVVRRQDPVTGTYRVWGPAFSLRPWFVEDDMFLLGRADFFSVFTITFEEGRGRVFHLDV